MDNKITRQSNEFEIDNFEIEPLSDKALDLVAGGSSSDGPSCCSCKGLL